MLPKDRHATLLDRLLAAYDRTGTIPPIGGGDHDPKDPPKDPPKLDAEVQTFVNGLLAEERRKTEERIQREADEAKKREDEERQRKEAEARGEFDTVKASLEEQIGKISGERDSLKTEHEALSTYFAAQFTAALEELPEAVTVFKPADDAPFAEKVAWLEKAQEAARKVGGARGPGNPPNPRPRTPTDDRDQEREKQRRQTRSKYSV